MNLWIAIAAVVYAFAETAYFGNNWTPKSDAEMVCDGIALLIAVQAIR